MAMSVNEYLKAVADGTLRTERQCSLCMEPITMADEQEGLQEHDGKKVHADCYYDAPSDIIEQNPPVYAGIRRG